MPSQQDKTPMCSVQNSTPSSKRIKREPKSSPEIKFEPEIKQEPEPFTIRGYFGFGDGQ